MNPDFYCHEVTIAPRQTARFDYCPRELVCPLWQFFFDEGATALELKSVTTGLEEQLVQTGPAARFVFSLPGLILGAIRAPLRAALALYNPTDKPVAVKVWIGDRGALRAELDRLKAS